MKLYLRAVASSVYSPTAGKKSTANPKYTAGANNATGSNEQYRLYDVKGGSGIGTSTGQTSDATTATRTNYLARFLTPPLAAQSLGAGTWTFAAGLTEANSAADSLLSVCVYTAAQGGSSQKQTIYDSSTDLGTEWATSTTGAGRVVTFSGSAVTIDEGDILVLEVFRNTDADGQSMSTGYSQLIYFGGSTEPTASSTISATDTASYLDTPAPVTFLNRCQMAYRFYGDGTETGSTALAAQSTSYTADVTADFNLQLRIRFENKTDTAGASTDDFTLAVSQNGGGYSAIPNINYVVGFNSANVAEGDATTNRLTGGTGTFVAGKVSEDAVADNLQVAAGNFTEFVYSLTLVSANLANGDYLDFRIYYNGLALDNYVSVPHLNITKSSGVPITEDEVTGAITTQAQVVDISSTVNEASPSTESISETISSSVNEVSPSTESVEVSLLVPTVNEAAPATESSSLAISSTVNESLAATESSSSEISSSVGESFSSTEINILQVSSTVTEVFSSTEGVATLEQLDVLINESLADNESNSLLINSTVNEAFPDTEGIALAETVDITANETFTSVETNALVINSTVDDILVATEGVSTEPVIYVSTNETLQDNEILSFVINQTTAESFSSTEASILLAAVSNNETAFSTESATLSADQSASESFSSTESVLLSELLTAVNESAFSTQGVDLQVNSTVNESYSSSEGSSLNTDVTVDTQAISTQSADVVISSSVSEAYSSTEGTTAQIQSTVNEAFTSTENILFSELLPNVNDSLAANENIAISWLLGAVNESAPTTESVTLNTNVSIDEPLAANEVVSISSEGLYTFTVANETSISTIGENIDISSSVDEAFADTESILISELLNVVNEIWIDSESTPLNVAQVVNEVSPSTQSVAEAISSTVGESAPSTESSFIRVDQSASEVAPSTSAQALNINSTVAQSFSSTANQSINGSLNPDEVFPQTESVLINQPTFENEVFTGTDDAALLAALLLQETAAAFAQDIGINAANNAPSELWTSSDAASIIILGGFTDIVTVDGLPVGDMKNFNGVDIVDIKTLNGLP